MIYYVYTMIYYVYTMRILRIKLITIMRYPLFEIIHCRIFVKTIC